MFARFTALLLVAMVAATSAARANPSLVIDVETGAVLHADEAGVPWYPASLTKLMTAYVTFERLRDDDTFTLDTEVTVSERAAREPASKMGVAPGTKVSVGRALEALIVYSANDIAVVLAEGVAGSIEAFAARMNATARRLGMTATTYHNPNGLPNRDQTTTARDLAILGRALIRDFPEHAGLFAEPVLRWGKRRLKARNSLLRTYDGADGMKTGFICASGYNVVATATRDGRRLLAVVLGAPSGDFRMQMAAHLLDVAFARHAAPLIDFGTVETLSNEASRYLAPPNLRSEICERGGPRPRIAKAGELDGWGALFGHFANRKSATSALNSSLAALRGIATGGKAAVVDGAEQSGYAAVLAGLTIDEVFDVCDHLDKAGVGCAALGPADVKSPPATAQ